MTSCVFVCVEGFKFSVHFIFTFFSVRQPTVFLFLFDFRNLHQQQHGGMDLPVSRAQFILSKPPMNKANYHFSFFFKIVCSMSFRYKEGRKHNRSCKNGNQVLFVALGV